MHVLTKHDFRIAAPGACVYDVEAVGTTEYLEELAEFRLDRREGRFWLTLLEAGGCGANSAVRDELHTAARRFAGNGARAPQLDPHLAARLSHSRGNPANWLSIAVMLDLGRRRARLWSRQESCVALVKQNGGIVPGFPALQSGQPRSLVLRLGETVVFASPNAAQFVASAKTESGPLLQPELLTALGKLEQDGDPVRGEEGLFVVTIRRCPPSPEAMQRGAVQI